MNVITDQLPCGVLLMDEGSVIKTINTTAQQHLSYAPGEVVGQPFDQLLTVASRLLYHTHLYPLLNLQGRIDEVILTLLTKQGHRIPVLFNAVRRSESEQIYGVYLPLGQRHQYEAELIQARQNAEAAQLALQQSEAQYRALAANLEARVEQRTNELEVANAHLLELNQDLTRANTNLGQFAIIASHDLQEPLRKIQAFSTLLSDRYGSQLGELGRELLGRMNRMGSRMSALIRDLFTYSRIAPRQQRFGPVSLSIILTQVLDSLALSISQRGAQLTLEDLPVVNGDASQLGQLLEQLLLNALTFTPADQMPRIQVSYRLIERSDLPVGVVPSRQAACFSRITVRDEGMGFDTKYLDRIFEVFQRLHGPHESAGTGIGLAICQRVVDNHGGAITADSQPGRGAAFYVYLPT